MTSTTSQAGNPVCLTGELDPNLAAPCPPGAKISVTPSPRRRIDLRSMMTMITATPAKR
jgi:hypothetical protein